MVAVPGLVTHSGRGDSLGLTWVLYATISGSLALSLHLPNPVRPHNQSIDRS